MLVGRFKMATACLALAVVGCSGGDGGDGDSDASSGVDSGEAGATLVIEIEADPELGAFDGDFEPTLDEVAISLSDFRAIGDAAPGDDRTRLAMLSLDFAESSEHEVSFNNAPIGRYSRIRARVNSFTARGTCVINAANLTWEIETTPPGGLELDIGISPVEVSVGQVATISLEVELDRPYDEVNWDAETPVGNVIRIDDSFRDIDEVRQKIIEAFNE